ncbi:alpha/beta hydrolase family protein [Aquabacterium sp.]|uniref:alpha/beta hydrolase family protein n=1 Tax=Aquabacterium sp. TaxID=1872578 RepID=UPI003D6CEFDC
MEETLRLQTSDGHILAARAYQPDGPVRRAVLISSAMGVPQAFYRAFATWLAQQGVAVLTFDCRGMGESAPKSLRGCVASITDWVRLDHPAALAELRRRWPGVPLTYLGHSLGGQIFGWLDGREHFDRMVTVASGSGYWRNNAPQVRYSVHFLWWVLAPVALTLAGYFPGERLGALGNIPKAVMWQWRRWCLSPDYIGSEGPALRARYAEVHTPITAVLAEDDELISPEGVRRLYRLYPNAPTRFESLQPQAHGLKRLGHFGLFKPQSSTALWPLALAWIAD